VISHRGIRVRSARLSLPKHPHKSFVSPTTQQTQSDDRASPVPKKAAAKAHEGVPQSLGSHTAGQLQKFRLTVESLTFTIPSITVTCVLRQSKGSEAYPSLPIELNKTDPRQEEDRSRLTRRERNVYDEILTGKSDKEIASVLGIGVRTVCSHVSNILHELNLSTRVEILARALKKSHQS
jgi:DNA-binding CsgD family transcriptional regulator